MGKKAPEKIFTAVQRGLAPAGLVLAGLVLVLTGIFFCRAPVILVEDEAFTLLYGKKRAFSAALALSLALFRPVKTAVVAPGAGPDLAAQAAAGLSPRPWGVFFPYRYREGARRYLRNRPGFPVAVLAGRQGAEESPGAGGEPLWIGTDTGTDLYRAGAAAGILTKKAGGTAVLYHTEPAEDQRRAFTGGFTGQGRPEGALVFVSQAGSAEDPALPGTPGCVVLAGEGGASMREAAAPLVLFTWLDPALVPRQGMLIFDDSPWAQLGPALELLKKGENGAVPSQMVVLDSLRAMKQEYLAINSLKTLKYNSKNTDN
ncbi:MAG: hypothetical protein LBO65_06115 [Spirochaetaceae bacterium]|jgi:hypothetical protein|nr:hypothetical protein [Spirochaetaceae bacterium]